MKTPIFIRRWRVPALLVLLALPVLLALGPSRQAGADPFVDPAFQAVWERNDGPVAGGAVARSWTWGPAPGAAKREAYAEGQGGVRLVQYFDKGRMEINNPTADPASPFYVTSGLLTVELISGRMQTGNNQFEIHAPVLIPLAGDRDDANAPTYAAFRAVSSVPGADHPAPDNTGRAVIARIDRDGNVTPEPDTRPPAQVLNAYYEPLTHHNVADVFWRFLGSSGPIQAGGQATQGPLFAPWFAVSGLPISEAYWATVKIAGKPADVLIQAFERRVLTYVPSQPQDWQVEMGNIGLHYFEWRYGGGPAPQPGVSPPAGPPALAQLAITGIVVGKSGLDLNEQTVTLENRGAAPVLMTGWRLVSPKNDHVDIYTFPQDFTLPAGAQVAVHAGQGFDGNGNLYMRRVTWLFDATGFDGVILYDNVGREVTRYFLQQGAVPTAPAPAASPQPTEEPPADATDTPEPTDTPEAGDTTATPTPESDNDTPTVTVTPGTPTVTATPGTRTATATATKTP